jgi:hypothetical protein
MRNQMTSPNAPENHDTQDHDATRSRVRRVRRNRKALLASGAVVAVGALVGSGFALQTAVADAHGGILEAQAVKQAEDTLTVAGDTLAEAEGKADAAELASTVATLEDYTYLAPERVFELAGVAAAHADQVKAEIAAFDKAAAEKAAAEQAAAPSTPSYPSGPANPSGAQAIARDLMSSMYGWGDDQFGCLVDLWNKESGWNVYATNPSSGAYGIPQALPGDKMATAGADWQTSAATQIKWGLGYISGRYGTPCGAWSHSVSVGWY